MPEADVFDVQLTVVREFTPPPYEKGVRTRVTARTFLRVIKHIEVGWAVTHSCKAEGFSYRRFRQLCQQRPNYQRRYEEAERQRAEHRRETMEAIVLHHAAKNWQAAGWWLERAHPERYALKSVVRDGDNQTQPIGEAIPAERFAHYGKLMLEMAEEDRVREAAGESTLSDAAKLAS
jgi:hypothetical protein